MAPGPIFKRKQAEDWCESLATHCWTDIDSSQSVLREPAHAKSQQRRAPVGWPRRRAAHSSTLPHQLVYQPAYHVGSLIPLPPSILTARLRRCLVLWNHDPTLDDALKLAKSILQPIDVLNALWPCFCMSPCFDDHQLFLTMRSSVLAIQQKCDSLRQQLVEACVSRGIEQPLPPTYTVPAFLRSP